MIKPVVYEAYSSVILDDLTSRAKGMTWSQLRERAGLSLITLPAIWVNCMETEHGLTRAKRSGPFPTFGSSKETGIQLERVPLPPADFSTTSRSI